jgi:hypothetical protein
MAVSLVIGYEPEITPDQPELTRHPGAGCGNIGKHVNSKTAKREIRP